MRWFSFSDDSTKQCSEKLNWKHILPHSIKQYHGYRECNQNPVSALGDLHDYCKRRNPSFEYVPSLSANTDHLQLCFVFIYLFLLFLSCATLQWNPGYWNAWFICNKDWLYCLISVTEWWRKILLNFDPVVAGLLPLYCLSWALSRNRLIRSDGMAKEIPAVTFSVFIPITSPSWG